MAISRGHEHIVNHLFQHGVKVEHQLRFMHSVKMDNLKVAKCLLQRKYVNIDAICDKYKLNALQLASKLGRLDFVKLLINNGANVNAKSSVRFLGKSPLHFAAMNHLLDVIIYLIDHGADVHQTDKFKSNALDLAEETVGNPEHKSQIINYLKSKKLKHSKSSTDEGPLRKRSIESLSTSDDASPTKVRKIMVDTSTSTDEPPNQEIEIPGPSTNSKNEIANLILPLKEAFLNKGNTFAVKMTCLASIDVIMLRETKVPTHIAKKEVIDEIANVVGEVVSRTDVEQNKDFAVIARILARLNCTNEGKNLINNMKLSFGAFEKLKAEMKKFEVDPDSSHFSFDFECKTDVKIET